MKGILFKDTLSPAAREAWDAANPAKLISADSRVQAAAADLHTAQAAYSAARRTAAKRLFPAAI